MRSDFCLRYCLPLFHSLNLTEALDWVWASLWRGLCSKDQRDLSPVRNWIRNMDNINNNEGEFGSRASISYCSLGWEIIVTTELHAANPSQEMTRVNVNILGSSKLKWTGKGEFNSDDHYIYYCMQESLRRNGVAIMVNKRVLNAVLGCNLKKDRMISVRFQGKPFNITVIQVYALISNAEEAEVEWFYEDLRDLLELTPKKDGCNVLFIIGDWNAKGGSQETPGCYC